MGVSRRAVLLGAVGCLAASVSGEVTAPSALGPTTTAWRRAHADPGALSRVQTGRPEIALTFDDGPDPDYTPAVLDILERFGARATFFLIGRNALAHPDLVRRLRDAGHEIANHTRNHAPLDTLSWGQVLDEVDQGGAAIREVGGSVPEWFRTPYGRTSPQVAGALRTCGLRTTMWSDSFEAHKNPSGRAPGSTVLDHAGPGSVILAHDGGSLDGPWPQRFDRGYTVEMLPRVLADCERRGLLPVTMTLLTTPNSPARGR